MDSQAVLPGIELEEKAEVNGIGLRHSLSMGALGKALAEASAEFEVASKDTSNPFFKSKYADLAELIRATRAALSKHGLVVVQSPRVNEKSARVTTMLLHSSGEWIADDLELPAAQGSKFDAQTVGSAITYARRYAYQSILNIAGEVDDDGNAASANHTKAHAAVEEEYNQVPEGETRISSFQIKGFWENAKKSGKTDAQVEAYLSTLGHVQVEDLRKGQFNDAIKWASKVNSPDTAEKLTEAVKDSVLTVKMRKLFAVAKEKSVPEADIKRYAYEAFAVESLKELSASQVDRAIEWVKGVA